MCVNEERFLEDYHIQALRLQEEWKSLILLIDDSEDICAAIKMAILIASTDSAEALDRIHAEVYLNLKIRRNEGVQGLNDLDLRKILEN